MIFIAVEGVTCAGKTTLVNLLKERLELDTKVQYEHKGPPEELNRRWVLKDYVLNHENYLPDVAGTPQRPSLLADRWHYGERVYSPIYRPETNTDGYGLLGIAGWRWVEMFLMSRGALVIRVDADNDVLARRLAERGDAQVKSEVDLMALAEFYRDAAAVSPSTLMTIDTSAGEPFDIDAIWFKGLQEETASAEILSITPQYIGNLRPNLLLVGNQRNITKRYGNETILPFMPVSSSSGVFLLEALDDDVWPLVGMVNGNDMDGSLRDLWEALGRPRPVALGSGARKSLLAEEFDPIEFSQLDHPAFVRRFHHETKGQYGEDITSAAELKGIYA